MLWQSWIHRGIYGTCANILFDEDDDINRYYPVVLTVLLVYRYICIQGTILCNCCPFSKSLYFTTMTKSRAPGHTRAGTRRNRDSIEDIPPLSPAELYEVQGDSAAAYKALSSTDHKDDDSSHPPHSPSLSTKYNQMLLSHLANSSTEGTNDASNLLEELEAWEQQWMTQTSKNTSNKKRQIIEWTCAYNRGLTLLAQGNPLKAVESVSSQVESFVNSSSSSHDVTLLLPNDLKEVGIRMAFLVLECVLSLSLARHTGILSSVSTKTGKLLAVKQVVDWLESQDMEQDPRNKFLVALFKSRMDFSERDRQGKFVDPKIRSAKKELKTAMEVFQQKLRPQAPGEASSVGSSSDVYSEESMSINTAAAGQHVYLSNVLKGHNQAALNLKANLEQLKGNPKKSLILCGEARASHPDPSYEAIHANNLSIVYQTNGKSHLALHAATKALQSVSDTKLFRDDGTARQSTTLPILHNAALYALQSGNYMSAYEYMATCVREQPSVYGQRPRCWLRMAEACIGEHRDKSETSQTANCRHDTLI